MAGLDGPSGSISMTLLGWMAATSRDPSSTLPEASLTPPIAVPEARIAVTASPQIRVPPSSSNRETNASARSDPVPLSRHEERR